MMFCKSLPRQGRRGVHSAISAAGLLVLGLVSAPAWSALPSAIKAGHPRLLLSPQRLQAVQAATVPSLTGSFPADRGRVTLVIEPAFRQPGERELLPLVDGYDGARNHLFIRHADGGDNANHGTVRLQIALQPGDDSAYVSHATVDVQTAVRSTLVVEWDNTLHRMTVTLNGQPVYTQPWRMVDGTPFAWRANQQRFVLGGRAGDTIHAVRVEDLATQQVLTDREGIDMTLQRSLQELLLWLDGRTRQLTSCTDPAVPTTCGEPFNLATEHPSTVETLAQRLAIAYRLSGDVRYLQAARNYAGKLLALPLLTGDEYSMRGRVAAFAMLYDWLFDEMRAAPAFGGGFASLADQMAQRALDHITAQKPNGTYEFGSFACGRQAIHSAPALRCASEPLIEWDRQAQPNAPTMAPQFLAGGHARGNVSAMAKALLAMADERPDTLPLLETIHRQFDKGYHAAREWLSVDGGHHMNYAYGSGYNDPMMSERLWQTALEPVNGQPVMAAAWQHKTWIPYLYGLRSDLRYPSSGDAFDFRMAGNSPALLAATEGGDGFAQAFYDDVIVPRLPASDITHLWDRLMFGRSTTPARSLWELPLSRHFRNAGFVTMRDSWDIGSATVLDFKSSSFASEAHHHHDQNSLSLFYRAPLLLDSGFYGWFGSPHWRNYATRTIAHNSMVVFDPAETYTLWGQEVSNDGGQWLQPGMHGYPTLHEARHGANRLDGIEAFAEGPEYSYTRGNASRAYARAKVYEYGGFVRHVAMLRLQHVWDKPLVMVFDQVKLGEGREALTPTLLFHTTREPVLLGGSTAGPGVHGMPFAGQPRRVFDVVNGPGRVFVESLWPGNATARKIGGVGPAAGDLRFATMARAADGSWALRSFTPLPAEEGLASQAALDAALAKDDVGAWRIEIDAPPAPYADRYREFLHVMSVADATPGLVPPNAVRLTSTSYSAAVLLGDRTVVMMFNAKWAGAPISWDLPASLPTDDYLVLGLQPHERFQQVEEVFGNGLRRVTLQRDPAGSLQASADGALRVMPAAAWDDGH